MGVGPEPLYTPGNIPSPAYQLRYTWTGWPSVGLLPKEPNQEFFRGLDAKWEEDGIRRLASHWSSHSIQLTCSVTPQVSPTQFTSRIKGRLQHQIRQAGLLVDFSRKVAFRTIGENRRQHVENYIENQVSKEQYVDPNFAIQMQKFTEVDSNVLLQEPSKTRSGRYWYNLHLVLVTTARMRFTDERALRRISETCRRIAELKGYLISRRSVMPDHLHLSLRGNLDHSPEMIALSFMNNLAYCMGQKMIWQPSYYVGSFGEYDMGAVRK